jgi:hypothetical protein
MIKSINKSTDQINFFQMEKKIQKNKLSILAFCHSKTTINAIFKIKMYFMHYMVLLSIDIHFVAF